MATITISRQYGSDGRTLGRLLAERLGYLYVDKELIVMIARQADVPLADVERFDERPENAALRVLRKLLVPSPEVALASGMEYGWWTPDAVPPLSVEEAHAGPLDEDRFVQLAREVMLGLAERGQVVLMGRGSQKLLTLRPDALHVRVVAPDEFRLKTAMERDGLSREQAQRRLRQVDEQRSAFIKRHYGADWDDPRHYHLVLNTGLLDMAAGVQVVVDALEHLPAEPAMA